MSSELNKTNETQLTIKEFMTFQKYFKNIFGFLMIYLVLIWPAPKIFQLKNHHFTLYVIYAALLLVLPSIMVIIFITLVTSGYYITSYALNVVFLQYVLLLDVSDYITPTFTLNKTELTSRNGLFSVSLLEIIIFSLPVIVSIYLFLKNPPDENDIEAYLPVNSRGFSIYAKNEKLEAKYTAINTSIWGILVIWGLFSFDKILILLYLYFLIIDVLFIKDMVKIINYFLHKQPIIS